jgi:hypothetical protein
MRPSRFVLIGALVCATVSVAPPVRAQVPDHLKCYKIKDPLKLAGSVDIETPQFGEDRPGANDCQVSKAKLFCVPATKTNVSGVVTLPFSGAPRPGDQICYKVKCRTPLSPIADQQVTDQFGTRTLAKFKASLLCVPAVKGTAYCGDGTIDASEECELTDLGGASCTSLGFAPGTLACAAGCTLDTSGCPKYPAPGSCGNGTIEPGETCDAPDLGGASCASVGFPLGGPLGCTATCLYDSSGCLRTFPATGQTICWNATGTVIPCIGTGQDGDVQAGATLSHTDNGDGTVTDEVTGLTWEKLSDDGSIHDMNNFYSWASAFALKIAVLNTPPCFADHCDWRLPNRIEVESIIDYQRYKPAVPPAFNTACTPGCGVLACSCTMSSSASNEYFWSSTTSVTQPISAWTTNFAAGGNNFGFSKTNSAAHVRAVRGGL